jgi:hypothetical protein
VREVGVPYYHASHMCASAPAVFNTSRHLEEEAAEIKTTRNFVTDWAGRLHCTIRTNEQTNEWRYLDAVLIMILPIFRWMHLGHKFNNLKIVILSKHFSPNNITIPRLDASHFRNFQTATALDTQWYPLKSPPPRQRPARPTHCFSTRKRRNTQGWTAEALQGRPHTVLSEPGN